MREILEVTFTLSALETKYFVLYLEMFSTQIECQFLFMETYSAYFVFELTGIKVCCFFFAPDNLNLKRDTQMSAYIRLNFNIV